LRESTRELDVKARTDETEFGLAMPETAFETAMGIAERLRIDLSGVSAPYEPVAAGNLSVSVGVATHPLHGVAARDLHGAARRARDRARLLGGNLVISAEGAAG